MYPRFYMNNRFIIRATNIFNIPFYLCLSFINHASINGKRSLLKYLIS